MKVNDALFSLSLSVEPPFVNRRSDERAEEGTDGQESIGMTIGKTRKERIGVE